MSSQAKRQHKMNKIIIETERTFLRHLTTEDAENFYRLNLDNEVLKYTGDKPFESIIAAEIFLKAYDQYEKYNVGRLAVIDKTENGFIGWCGLKYSQNLNEYDIGFRFFRKYWNKGYATETSKACIDFGFRKLELNKIIGRAMKENIASIKVLEKIGLTYIKDFDFDRQNGVIYEITKNKYEQTSPNR